MELITVSSMYQQFDLGERLGAYPDSISDFQHRNPAFLNPEDILVNVLALKGYDPDIETARVKREHETAVISSGAQIIHAQSVPAGLRFQLRFFKSEPSHTLIVGVRPREVRIDGRPLLRSQAPVRREPGWWWDEQRQFLYLTARHEQESITVEVRDRD